MTTSYEKIFNRFLARVTDYSFADISEDDLLEMEVEWLTEAAANPRVRRLYNTLSLDDEVMQIEFELRQPVDDEADTNFTIKLLSLGMTIEWLQPKVDSVLNVAPVIGGKEEKKLLDNTKYSIDRLDSMKVEQMKMIRDHGYMYNDYIHGDAS